MIRINLLPVRAAKKKESIRFQLTVAGLIILLVIAVMGGVYFRAASEASAISAEIQRGQEELRRLKARVGELSRIKEQKRIVEEKLRIVRSLEQARTGPSELFGKISEAIPKEAWLSSLQDQGNRVTLTGYAAGDEVVADFMRGLEKFKDLGNVELDVARRVKEKETGSDVVNFIIRLDKAPPAPGR